MPRTRYTLTLVPLSLGSPFSPTLQASKRPLQTELQNSQKVSLPDCNHGIHQPNPPQYNHNRRRHSRPLSSHLAPARRPHRSNLRALSFEQRARSSHSRLPQRISRSLSLGTRSSASTLCDVQEKLSGEGGYFADISCVR